MFKDLPTVLAAAAALVSIVLGVSQVTTTSRLRKQSAFWREAAAIEPPNQRAVLHSLHRDALARLVARQAISLWGLLFPTMLLLACTYSFFDLGKAVSGYRVDGSGIDLLSLDAYFGYLIALLFVASTTCTYPYFWYERRRIYDDYLAGRDLVRRRIPFALGISGHDAGPYLQDSKPWRRTVGPGLFAIGTSAVAFWVGLFTSTPEGTAWWVGLPAVVGAAPFVAMALTLAGLSALATSYRESIAVDWHHAARATSSGRRRRALLAQRPSPRMARSASPKIVSVVVRCA